jgi:hypothetical protein
MVPRRPILRALCVSTVFCWPLYSAVSLPEEVTSQVLTPQEGEQWRGLPCLLELLFQPGTAGGGAGGVESWGLFQPVSRDSLWLGTVHKPGAGARMPGARS